MPNKAVYFLLCVFATEMGIVFWGMPSYVPSKGRAFALEKPNQTKIFYMSSKKRNSEISFRSGRNARVNILILGIDARDHNVSRADMIMVVNINAKTKSIHLVSIPRDTKIFVKGFGYTKMNHTHLIGQRRGGNRSGTQVTSQTVANLLHCRLDYYIKVDFKGYTEFIDTLGGLDIQLPKPVKLTEKSMILPAGNNHLNGEMTLELTRERFSLKNGDFGRQQNQFMILKAIAKQTFQFGNIVHLSDLITKVRKDVVDTNLTDFDLLCLAWIVKQVPEQNLTYYQIPGRPERGVDPLTKTVVFYWNPSLESIQRIRKHFQ